MIDIDASKESFFISDVLKGVLDYDSLERADINNSEVLNSINVNGKEFDFELFSFEIKNVDDEYRFKLELSVPAFKIKDCLQISTGGGTVRIDGSSFEFCNSDLHWNAKNKILTCYARLCNEKGLR
jgi:hypothetical protein